MYNAGSQPISSAPKFAKRLICQHDHQGGKRTDGIESIIIAIVELELGRLVNQPVEVVDLFVAPNRVRTVDVRQLVDDAEELVVVCVFVIGVLDPVQASGVIDGRAVYLWVGEWWVGEECGTEQDLACVRLWFFGSLVLVYKFFSISWFP